MEIRELVAKLGIKFDGAGLVKAEQGISAFKASTLALTAVLAGAVAGLAHSVFSTIKYGDELFHTSEKIGIGVEQLQKFQYAAGIVDVSSETLTRSIGLLSKRLFEAQHNGKQAATALAAIGIKNPKGVKDTTELIYRLADKVSSLKSGTDKAGIVLKVFGRSGLTLIPFLNQGAEGMKKFGEEAQAMGIILDKETIEKAKETEHSLLRLKLIVEGLKRAIAAQFIPQIEDLTNSMIQWLAKNGALIKQGMTGLFKGMYIALEALVFAFRTLGVALDVILAPFGGLKKHIDWLGGAAGIALVVAAVYNLAKAVSFLTGGFIALDSAALPWLVIAGAIALAIGEIYLFVQDLISLTQGKNSLFGKLLYWSEKDGSPVKKFFEDLEDRLLRLISLTYNFLHPFSKPINLRINHGSILTDEQKKRGYVSGSDISGQGSKIGNYLTDGLPGSKGVLHGASKLGSVFNPVTSFIVHLSVQGGLDASQAADKIKLELEHWFEKAVEKIDQITGRNFESIFK